MEVWFSYYDYIYDVNQNFNEGLMANQKKMEDMKDDIEGEIIDNYNELRGDMVTGVKYHSNSRALTHRPPCCGRDVSETKCNSDEHMCGVRKRDDGGENIEILCCPLPTVVKD